MQQPQEFPADEFERSLIEVEASLVDLKQRYTQVQHDLQCQAQLQQRRQELGKTKDPQFQAELKQIKAQLETIEVNLESQLFSWGNLKEPFWQAVRFGGLGVIVGWILRSCAS